MGVLTGVLLATGALGSRFATSGSCASGWECYMGFEPEERDFDYQKTKTLVALYKKLSDFECEIQKQ